MKPVLHEFKVHRVPGHLLDLKTDCYFGESQFFSGRRQAVRHQSSNLAVRGFDSHRPLHISDRA